MAVMILGWRTRRCYYHHGPSLSLLEVEEDESERRSAEEHKQNSAYAVHCSVQITVRFFSFSLRRVRRKEKDRNLSCSLSF